VALACLLGEVIVSYKPVGPDLDSLSEAPNVSGASPRQIAFGEDAAQRAVAENPTWLLARQVNNPERGDSLDSLEQLGFTIRGTHDNLFYEVTPPEGWTKSTEGYWTTIFDGAGAERMTQFFKGAFYDQRAFLNINS
jgi:hypothetical protein